MLLLSVSQIAPICLAAACCAGERSGSAEDCCCFVLVVFSVLLLLFYCSNFSQDFINQVEADGACVLDVLVAEGGGVGLPGGEVNAPIPKVRGEGLVGGDAERHHQAS